MEENLTQNDYVIKAAEVLSQYLKDKKDADPAYLIVASDKEGPTIAIEGNEIALLVAISYSMSKNNLFGQLLKKAAKINAMIAIDELGKLTEKLQKLKNNGTDK